MNILNFFKVDQAGKLAVKFVSMILFRKKYFFRLEYEAFLAKNKKTLYAGKKTKECFAEKKSRLSKLNLYQIGKSQNFPVVAGRSARFPTYF